MRNPIIAVAERSLRAWADDLSRESAARMLDMWSHADELSADDRAEVLSRFAPAEPPMVPLKDFLPEPDPFLPISAGLKLPAAHLAEALLAETAGPGVDGAP